MVHTRSTANRATGTLEQILPAELIERFRNELDKPLTAQRVRAIAQEFDIEKQFSVSPRRLGCFLRKLQSAEEPAKSGECSQSSGQSPGTPWTPRMKARRKRQITIAAILDATFGRLAESSPDLWAKRAYLMLVGVVYDRLASAEKELDTEELIVLAKVLAESRRAELRAHEKEGRGKACRGKEAQCWPALQSMTNGRLPEHLADTVRQIYGIQFKTTDRQTVSHAPQSASQTPEEISGSATGSIC